MEKMNEEFEVEIKTWKIGEILFHCFSEWSPDGNSSF